MIRQQWTLEQSAPEAGAPPQAHPVAGRSGGPAGAGPLWDEDGDLPLMPTQQQGAGAARRPTELDHQEFQAMVDRWSSPLLSYLRHLCGELQDAEDLLQETFLKAWEQRAALRDPRAVRSWLFTVAGNTWRRQHRAGPRSRSGPLLPLPDDMQAAPQAPPWSDTLLKALAELSADERRIVLLTGRHGYTLPEAAALVGCSAAAGGKRWQRGCRRLAEILGRRPTDTRGDGRHAGAAGGKEGRP